MTQDLSLCDNSFLVECDYVDGVSRQDRLEIERRFKNSKINSSYVFPRHKSNVRKKVTPVRTSAASKSRILINTKNLSLSRIRPANNNSRLQKTHSRYLSDTVGAKYSNPTLYRKKQISANTKILNRIRRNLKL